MRLFAFSSALLLIAGTLGSAPASASASPSAAAPATQEKPAAPAETKDVAVSADPIATIKKFIEEQKIDKTKDGWRTRLPKPPQLTFDPKKTYYWVMETNKGTMKLKLRPDVAPMHVSNCIYLNTLGYYDTLPFHRVIKGFMAQGGCPRGKGDGSPGYTIKLEVSPNAKHSKDGTLSTARTNDPDSAGSQFFLTFGPQAALDPNARSAGYTVYGELVEGTDVLRKIEACGRDRDPAPPTEPLSITKGTITVE